MDSFKFASALNEWQTWSSHAASGLEGHPNLVQLHGFQQGKECIQIYSEYCSGGDVQVGGPGIGGPPEVFTAGVCLCA